MGAHRVERRDWRSSVDARPARQDQLVVAAVLVSCLSRVLSLVHDAVTSVDGAYKSPLVHAHAILNGLLHGGAGLAWIYTDSAEFRAGPGWTAWFCLILLGGIFGPLGALGNARKPDLARAGIIAVQGAKLGDYAVGRFAAAFGG